MVVRSVVTKNVLLGTQLWFSAKEFFPSASQNVSSSFSHDVANDPCRVSNWWWWWWWCDGDNSLSLRPETHYPHVTWAHVKWGGTHAYYVTLSHVSFWRQVVVGDKIPVVSDSV